jgi:Putative rhamnosyl transferase
MLHAAAEEKTEFLNFPRGIIWYSGKCYLYRHSSNAFLSMVEPAAAPRTVWLGPHEDAARVAPVRQLAQTPAFLQVIHGKNVSNKPRGTRMNARRALIGFEAIEALQGRQARESATGIMLENATSVVLWKLRDWLISMAKPLRR